LNTPSYTFVNYKAQNLLKVLYPFEILI